MPSTATKKRGRQNFFNGRALIDAYADRPRRGRQPHARIPPPADAELFSGSDSPALERFRLARAEQVELDLARQRGQLLPREEVHAWMARLGGTLRATCETLQRQFGRQAAAMIQEALDDYEREVRERFDSDAGNQTSHPR